MFELYMYIYIATGQAAPDRSSAKQKGGKKRKCLFTA